VDPGPSQGTRLIDVEEVGKAGERRLRRVVSMLSMSTAWPGALIRAKKSGSAVADQFAFRGRVLSTTSVRRKSLDRQMVKPGPIFTSHGPGPVRRGRTMTSTSAS
jgi:hypothetical protein